MPNGNKDDQRNANLGDINSIYENMNKRFDKLEDKIDNIENKVDNRINEKIKMHKHKCSARDYYNLTKQTEKKHYRNLILVIMGASVLSTLSFKLLGLLL